MKNTRELLPVYAAEEPISLPKARRFDAGRFTKRYGILILAIGILTAWTLGVYGYAFRRGAKLKEAELRDLSEQAVQDYKDRQQQEKAAEYFLSGEASREAARNQDAVALARDGGVWKTEASFKAYCWNVVIRTMHSQYPGSVREVLEQPGQYDFHRTEGAYSDEKFEWALEVLLQAETGRLPTYLTTEHVYLEMRDGGNDCVLHTEYDKNKTTDDPWRYRGE